MDNNIDRTLSSEDRRGGFPRVCFDKKRRGMHFQPMQFISRAGHGHQNAVGGELSTADHAKFARRCTAVRETVLVTRRKRPPIAQMMFDMAFKHADDTRPVGVSGTDCRWREQ